MPRTDTPGSNRSRINSTTDTDKAGRLSFHRPQNANFSAELSNPTPFEPWSEAGSQDMQQRALSKWKSMLQEYQMPAIDPAIDEALLDFIARRKASMVDAWY